MNNFLDIYLPGFLAFYVSGGPVFNTNIISTKSGREIRQSENDHGSQEYIIKNCRLSLEEFEIFNAFFRNCRGSKFSFRLRDHSDHKLAKQILVSDNQKNFPVIKSYIYQNQCYIRRIVKPLDIKVFVNQEERIEPSIDYNIGVINIDLQDKEVLTIDAIFDVPVRFCADKFSYAFYSDGSVSLDPIIMKEITI